jgi:hypothetical protein
MKVNLEFIPSGVYFVWNATPPSFTFCVKYEEQHSRCDPKDGELYLRKVKPGEILVEACHDTDVQIVRLTWV